MFWTCFGAIVTEGPFTAAATPRISAPLVAALEATWKAIAKHDPDVPPAVVAVASGTQGRKSSEARWGHFAALRWVRGYAQLPEVLIDGEGLARGAESVMATLLHEAAHGLAHVRKIDDTSRQGRYHNRRYRALAQELGLDVAEAAAFGWSSTTLGAATIKKYRREPPAAASPRSPSPPRSAVPCAVST